MGILISLSGTDNVGKSTQANLLVRQFKRRGKKVKVTEFAFGYYLLKPLIKRLRKATDGSTGGPVAVNTRLLPKLWFLPAFFDIWIGYVFYLRPLTGKTDVVIADRFYTDIWVNLLYYGYCPEWAFEFLVRYLPRADVSLLLFVDPNKGFGRDTDDFELGYYTKQVKIYKKLSKLTGSIVIDAGRKQSVVASNMLGAIDSCFC